MASAIATANPDRRATRGKAVRRERSFRFWSPVSRLGRTIIGLNVLGLAIIIGGVLALNEVSRGLIDAKIDSLQTQGDFIVKVLDQTATVGEPDPELRANEASDFLQLLFIPRSQRARLFDAHGEMLADSYVVADRVEWRVLPPARRPGDPFVRAPAGPPGVNAQTAAKARDALAGEVKRALAGHSVSGVRVSETGGRVVSVSMPIQHVQRVLGVLTLESGDVDQIIAAQRKALLPFIMIAAGVILISSVLLNVLIARPVLRLARAADQVRLEGARSITLPDLAGRNDELGDLTQSLEDMTDALSERMDAIERFAADVAHEIRNPLTSIRSAVETLDLVKAEAPRQRLLKILEQDVIRLDRLVTDIANASRLDAELSRESPRRVELERLLVDIVSIYDSQTRSGEAKVRLIAPDGVEAIAVLGREGPLGQVFRNLIDNARSFSPPDGAVRITIGQAKGSAIVAVEDDGPGIPPENLETVFQRFYTSRPKGQAFGSNSGLGLSIARQIVEAHNGEIHAENRKGAQGVAGARFVVSLPLARP